MASDEELLEKVETFQNLLISYATGGQVTDAEYRSLREQLVAEPQLKEILPRFVPTNRDFNQFWPFIKEKSSTYKGRRAYLWSEFAPV